MVLLIFSHAPFFFFDLYADIQLARRKLPEDGPPTGTCPDGSTGTYELRLENFEEFLPTTANIKHARTGSGSYFLTDVANSDPSNTDFNGDDYLGWCIDNDLIISMNTWYGAHVFSSYDDDVLQLPNDIFDDLVEWPDNLDLVNYILNEYNGGTYDGTNTYPWQCIQLAIWSLIEDTATGTLGGLTCSQDRVEAIVNDAHANGEGYVPYCGGVIAVIVPILNDGGMPYKQTTIIEYPLALDTKYCSLVCPIDYVSLIV